MSASSFNDPCSFPYSRMGDKDMAFTGEDLNHSVSLQVSQTEIVAVATQDSALPTQPPCSPMSQTSLRISESEPICRICLDRGTEPLVAPCKCAGSAKFAHESCLLQWFFKTRRRKCELCLSEVNVKSVGFKPLQKWRLPTDSCDFVFYLFTLYCVIMFVFTGMIIWIATQGCLSPVCITLYVICSMSLVYFIYCCGCVEYSKTYWKACVTTNKNWRIYNREESAKTKVKAARIASNGSESENSKKCNHVVVDQPGESSGLSTRDANHIDEQRSNFSLQEDRSISGSNTILHFHNNAEDTRRIEVVSPQIVGSPYGSPGCLSPVFNMKDLAHAGSISLLMELNYGCQQSKSLSGKGPRNDRIVHVQSENSEVLKQNTVSVDAHTQTTELSPAEEEENASTTGACIAIKGDGVSNKGFDDTKL